jgi:hypothetical protein
VTYPTEPRTPGYNPLPPTPDTSGQFYLGPPPRVRRTVPRWAVVGIAVGVLMVVAVIGILVA